MIDIGPSIEDESPIRRLGRITHKLDGDLLVVEKVGPLEDDAE